MNVEAVIFESVININALIIQKPAVLWSCRLTVSKRLYSHLIPLVHILAVQSFYKLPRSTESELGSTEFAYIGSFRLYVSYLLTLALF